MTVAKVYSAAPVGFDGQTIEVESHATKGLPSIQIVGMANKSIDEAKERVKSALLNSLFEYPAKRLTINLAPAELPKDGTHYDIAIALSILIASNQLQQSDINDALFAGELALDGSIRPIKGAITVAETAQKSGKSTLYLPSSNVAQAQLVPGITIIGVSSLKELFLHLKKELIITPAVQGPVEANLGQTETKHPNLDDIVGQEQAKRALIIAAAGRHNILLKGSPGTGKTMLAQTLLHLLPPPSPTEQLAITKMHSLSGEAVDSVMIERPFRAPHHTASRAAIVGGGTKPQPGEISLAHLGVLFLDELPEYPRSTLESLRQPLEDRQISISRAQGKLSYPADIMLVATMNPCPCGYLGDASKECSCSQNQISSYQKRLSGPLLDRIDLTVTVPRVPQSSLLKQNSLQHTQHKNAYEKLTKATERQRNRFKSSDKYNSNLTSHEIRQRIHLSESSQKLLAAATEKLQLSTRAYFRVIRIARTIADLEDSTEIHDNHIAEALQYRSN